MLAQIKILTKLELCNLCGYNILRHTRDRKWKHRFFLMAGVWVLVTAMIFFYVGGLSYGFIQLGLSEVIPAYLITLASLFVFVFGIFKSGSMIFKPEGYDMICSLPVSKTAIVISRFLRMYAADVTVTAGIMFPGFLVYAVLLKPAVSFYILAIFGVLFVPLLPMAAAVFLGALITGISSRMKHKSLVSSGLSILLVLVFMLASSQSYRLEGSVNVEMLKDMSATIFTILRKVYVPAVWFGSAMETGNIAVWFACVGLFLVVAIAVLSLVSVSFHGISRRLYGISAKHNYKMEQLEKDAVLVSLCKREFKRYFSSSVYVVNTIVGPIMGTVFSSAVFFVGTDFITEEIPIAVDIPGLMPFVLSAVLGMMTTTSTSISMEGKTWWIVKSLPLSTKTILDAKILMNLLLMLPFYLVSEGFLILALKPDAADLLMLILIPLSTILFSCVYGITINLHFPVFDWESETSVVKQSASAMFGGMGGMLLSILCIVVLLAVPKEYVLPAKAVILVLLFAGTAGLYWKNNRKDLCKL